MDEKEFTEALDSLEDSPLTETQQRLVNYLRANKDDVLDALSPDDPTNLFNSNDI